jgi:hypothetical protein
MSNPKFSPGPWKLVTHTDYSAAEIDSGSDWTVTAKNGDAVCFEGGDTDFASGNAQLIAAAPELYAALEQCYLVLAGASMTKNSLIDALKSAQESLSKARGDLSSTLNTQSPVEVEA